MNFLILLDLQIFFWVAQWAKIPFIKVKNRILFYFFRNVDYLMTASYIGPEVPQWIHLELKRWWKWTCASQLWIDIQEEVSTIIKTFEIKHCIFLERAKKPAGKCRTFLSFKIYSWIFQSSPVPKILPFWKNIFSFLKSAW